MEEVYRTQHMSTLYVPPWEHVRRAVSYGLTLVGLWTMCEVYSHHWDPVSYLIIGFFIAPLILPFLGLGWDGIRIMLLSSVAVAVAAFVLPWVYLGILISIAYTAGSGLSLYVLVACVLAPVFEELVKGSLWILEKGDWRYGAALGLGFGCFEATSYLMVYGIDIAFLRWQGTILHVVATAMMFQGLSMKQWRWVTGSILLHMLYNSLRILVMR